MASEVEIANAALLRIGENTITSFSAASEDDKGAILAANTFAIHRDALLRAIPWTFAIQRASLAASTTDPVWEFDYRYPLPEEPYFCLRVLTVDNAADYDWRVEGHAIVTDIGSPLYIKYIARIEDPEKFDALFTETLIAKLQWEWAEALTKDPSLRLSLMQEYIGKRNEAASVTGMEGKTEPRPGGSWYEAHVY